MFLVYDFRCFLGSLHILLYIGEVLLEVTHTTKRIFDGLDPLIERSSMRELEGIERCKSSDEYRYDSCNGAQIETLPWEKGDVRDLLTFQ